MHYNIRSTTRCKQWSQMILKIKSLLLFYTHLQKIVPKGLSMLWHVIQYCDFLNVALIFRFNLIRNWFLRIGAVYKNCVYIRDKKIVEKNHINKIRTLWSNKRHLHLLLNYYLISRLKLSYKNVFTIHFMKFSW